MHDRKRESQFIRDPTTLSFVGHATNLPASGNTRVRLRSNTMKSASHKAAPVQQHGRLSRGRGALLPRTIATVVWLLFTGSSALGQQKASEYQVKAAYLYNFGRFIEWPAGTTTAKSSSFTICVLGEDPFGPSLDRTLAGEMIGDQKVAAKRILSPQESVDCQILYIGSSEANQFNKIIEKFDKTAVLTVSDIPHFSKRGGMIQFVMEENRIRFEVNLTAAQRAGLTLSSELLKVATVVRKNSQPGD